MHNEIRVRACLVHVVATLRVCRLTVWYIIGAVVIEKYGRTGSSLFDNVGCKRQTALQILQFSSNAGDNTLYCCLGLLEKTIGLTRAPLRTCFKPLSRIRVVSAVAGLSTVSTISLVE